MGEAEVKALVALILCRGQVVLTLFEGHAVPYLVSLAVGIYQHEPGGIIMIDLRIDVDIEQFDAD